MTNNANFNGLTRVTRTGDAVLRTRRLNMGSWGKHTMIDNGYWSEEVRGMACMTYIFYPEDS